MSGSAPVGDDDDAVFAAMAGAGVLIAIVVAMLMPLSNGGASPVPGVAVAAHSTTTTTPQETSTTGPTETDVAPQPTIPSPTGAELEARLVSAGFPSVRASVVDHEVTLTGTLGSESLRAAVLGVVLAIDGVTSIVDNMVVG